MNSNLDIYWLQALVAQLDRALDYESRGQEFESSRARHFCSKVDVLFPRVFGSIVQMTFKSARNCKVVFFIGLCGLYFTTVQAHENINSPDNTFLTAIKNTLNSVSFEENKNTIVIKSNGIPDHETGNFPRKGNPHAISAQRHILHLPKNPKKNDYATPSKFFGVAVNGVMFVPETIECWNPHKSKNNGLWRKTDQPILPKRTKLQAKADEVCKWRKEAIVGQKKFLGLDTNNAHVQPNGMYHYHGIPSGLLKSQQSKNQFGDLLHVGYAGDGFKIFVSLENKFKSSYKLKIGNRFGGPEGTYDGSYTQDFYFLRGSGHLDECNGVTTDEYGYIYLITNDFPFVPRCWKGNPDQTFKTRP